MNKVSYMGNGEIVEFDFTFPFYENNNVVVLKNNKPATGYVIVGVSAGENADVPYMGGRVVFDFAPLPTDSIVISRKLPLSRVVDYQPLAKIEPKLLNLDMNYLMESLKDFQDELDTFNEKYNGIVNVESVEVLLKKANFIEQLIQNEMLVTLDDFNSGITNCITEIPQDIKLELNNGTLTLNAGSKVYVPNGAGVFDVRNINSDTALSTPAGTNQWLCAISAAGTILTRPLSNCVSGAGATATTGFAYDTTANNIGFYNASGVLQYSNISLPICIITTTDSVITSIDQVFNGFGYIGGTIFTLPGVKGLAPNGRNSDGTLKNREFYFSKIIVKSYPNTGGDWVFCLSTNSIGLRRLKYDDDKNENIQTTDNTKQLLCNAGTISLLNGTITSFALKTAFHADT